MRGRLAFAVVAAAIALVASGSGGSTPVRVPSQEGPAYGLLSTGRAPDGQTLVRLDPRTLAPAGGRRLRLPSGLTLAGRSPDGRHAAFLDHRQSLLRVVDLRSLRVVGEVRLAPRKRWRARAAAWLTADRVAVVEQRMRGSYHQIVDYREVVLVDPLAHRVVARRPLAGAMALQGAASGGGRLVLLIGRSDRGEGALSLAVVDAGGRVRTTRVDLRRASADPYLPSLVVEQSGRRAFVVAPGAPVLEVDLETLRTSSHAVSGGGDVFRPAALASRHALLVDGRTLAVGGANHASVRGERAERPVGVALVDTTTWQARLVDEEARGLAAGAGTLLAFGPGAGLRAYELDGTSRWRRFAGEDLGASVFRDRALVYRHARGRLSGPLVVELSQGRQVGRSRTLNFWLLPDVPASERRLSAAERDEPAIHVDGAGESFSGTVRADVTRLVAVLVDGRELEVEHDGARVAYEAGSPERSARLLRAYAGDRLLATITLRVRCGGSAGPCAASGGGDPFARVSNRGRRVAPKARTVREREHVPRDLFLLRSGEGRAVYRIGGLRAGYAACFASGPGGDVGRIGLSACSRDSLFPSRRLPVFDMSAIGMSRGDTSPHLLFLAGVAADGIAEIGLADADGAVLERVPVEDNVYLLAAPPTAATGEIVAFTRDGDVVYRSDRRGGPAPRPANPRLLAGFRIKLRLPRGWRGEIRRSGAGPARALVLARKGRASLALDERDPRSRPAFPRLKRPPQLSSRGRSRLRFTLNGRQFTLDARFGARRPSASQIAVVNRILRTLEVGAIAVPPAVAAGGIPLQRGSADGVAVDVSRSGAVVFRFAPASPVRRTIRDGKVTVACLTFDSTAPWETNEWWASRPFAETVRFASSEGGGRPSLPYATLDPQTGAVPPFAGCLVSGSHGRRWDDPRGQHSPAEIAFTADGRRFFDERAVARDLAQFVRVPAIASIRRALKRGGSAPAAALVTRGLPARVVAIANRGAAPSAGRIGVWTNRRDVVEVSGRSARGKRLFVELRGGRISRHNLDGLAFVF